MRKTIALILALSLLCGCTTQPAEVQSETPASVTENTETEPSVYEEDALYLVEQVEDIHPCFVLDDVPENYEAAKEAYLSTAQNCDEAEFNLATRRYVSSLRDGHSTVGLKGLASRALDLNSIYLDGTLWLLDENDYLTETRILSIDGVPAEDIFAVVEELFPIENESGYVMYRYHAMFDGVLKEAGVNVSQDSVNVVFEKNGQEYNESVSFTDVQTVLSKLIHQTTVSHSIMDDIFYIDLNKCVVDDNLRSTIVALDEVLQNGMKKVIIDVRGNSGGSSKAGLSLLETMGMIPPLYTQTIRTRGTDQYRVEGPDSVTLQQKVVSNPDIRLLVLCDEFSFSSANHLCVSVQDGKLGKLVGRPSANNDNCYGYGSAFALPNSQLNISISAHYWERPDQNASHDRVDVDVYVPHNEDILDTAVKILRE